TNSPDCAVDTGGNCVNAPILDIEIENSNAPNQVAPPNCYLAADNPRTATIQGGETTGLVPRGCKRHLKLTLTQPTAVTPKTVGVMNTVGKPGTLTLADAETGQELAKLTGVYSFRCGQTPTVAGGTVPGQQQLRYEIQVKGRKRNQNRSTDPQDLEGWYPVGDPNFTLGPRREISGTAGFRNLINYGIHYGKTLTSLCVKDGPVPAGVEANCCSGYWADTNTCVPANQCQARGTTTSGPDGDLLCCSHRAFGGRCL
ncbi:MAG TPA: hypothetical protein VL588_08475, partial [Bdellovibrionota bacterium]|nr:hypothetical protein [Bdellovibrionota bacterium]